MITALDSNILIALWDVDNTLNLIAEPALDSAHAAGSIVVAAPVYAELLAYPRRTEEFLDSFFAETGIKVDWNLDESIWRSACGLAYQSYAARRRKQSRSEPRRIQADFLIGAHALENGYRLLTFDDRLYRAAFPRLAITAI